MIFFLSKLSPSKSNKSTCYFYYDLLNELVTTDRSTLVAYREKGTPVYELRPTITVR